MNESERGEAEAAASTDADMPARVGASYVHTGGWRVVSPIQYLSTSTGAGRRAELGEVISDIHEDDAKKLFARGDVEPELA
jgi:hypothetical protein